MTSVIPKISHLSKSVIRVLGCNPGPMTLQGTNTYIIGNGKRRALFDAGENGNSEYISNLSSVLKENDIQLNMIIISHWHQDHIGGLKDVLNLASDGDLTVLKYPRKDKPDPPLEVKPSQVQWLKGDEEIKIEGATIKVHYTPGHTTDHVVLSLLEENSVFSGDCILGEGTAVFEDLFDYLNSLKVILGLKPTTIYPGHGPVIEDPMDRIQYYLDHRHQREVQIMEVMSESPSQTFSPMDLVKIIYKDTPLHLHIPASLNVSHHLKKLEKENRVKSVGDGVWMVQSGHSNL